MEILQLEQLSFQYPTEDKGALEQIDLCIQPGEFIVLCGNSGSGKTTLLRHMKSAIMPQGKRSGRILFHGIPLSEAGDREQAGSIGYVSQNPEDQLVTDQVWHELAFGLESLGLDKQTIRKRVAEMSHFFGIQEWFHKGTAELSGGQKQLLNLASVMVMQPELLLLDEPASQLDPIAALDFAGVLHRIHRELGTTIVMTEHHLEHVLPYSSRLVVLEQGRIILDGKPRETAEEMRSRSMKLFAAMPAPLRIWNAIEDRNVDCPMSVQEGREWFTGFWETHAPFSLSKDKKGLEEEQREKVLKPLSQSKDSGSKPNECTVELKDVWFRYEKKGRDVLQDFSLSACRGELLAVLGGNGSGKTTILSVINEERRPYKGRVLFPNGRKGMITLPQNPQLLFLEATVQKDLETMVEPGSFRKKLSDSQEEIASVIKLCKLDDLLNRHPYDLSGGEQQRLALAKVLLAQPEILLLDEPTKGLDVEYKAVFAGILRQLTGQGITIIMVSHDIQFCAEYADRCALIFDGQVAAEDAPGRFFAENHFYTTDTNRMVRHLLPWAVTVEDVIQVCGGEKSGYQEENTKVRLPGSHGEGQLFRNQEPEDLSANQGSEPPPTSPAKESIYLEDHDKSENPEGSVTIKKSIPLSVMLGIAVFLLAIPLTIFIGIYFLKDEKYLFISLFILLECMLPFFFAYESRKPTTRDMVLLSVLCGIGVAGRAVFSTLAQVKPVTAITIIAGAAFGGETGFLTGALTMLVSNMIFGQGPWTPWQMFAMGLIGLGAGLLFHREGFQRIRKKSWLLLLCIYGFLSPVLLYGGIMNPASAIMSGIALDWNIMFIYWGSGLPFDLIHGGTTCLFLLLGARPMLRKLERVKIKFG